MATRQKYEIVFRWLIGPQGHMTPNQQVHETDDGALYGETVKWTEIVNTRSLWQDSDCGSHQDDARALLATMGVGDEQVEAMAAAQHVEVSLPYSTDDVGYAARVMPWEYLISAATREWRREKQFIVTRHLARKRAGRAAQTVAKSRAKPLLRTLLFIESAPAPFNAYYSFESEREALRAIFGEQFSEPPQKALQLSDIRPAIEQRKPHAIHVSGIDTHEGSELLGKQSEPDVTDGCYFRDIKGQPAQANYIRLAGELIPSGKNAPRIVTLNFYFSGARIAARCVYENAGAAIGLQNTFDNAAAENFFVRLYQALFLAPDQLLTAFRHALSIAKERLVSSNQRLRGTGVILWTANSLIDGGAEKDGLVMQVSNQFATEVDDVVLDWEEMNNINYASLHNGRSIFKRFNISPKGIGFLKDVNISVSLAMGHATIGFEENYNLNKNEKVNAIFPLDWPSMTTINETVKATINVKVRAGDRLLRNETKSTKLSPLGEWIDNKDEMGWLASFVFPRDLAITNIIKVARRNLRVLAANYSAGFDGYQSGVDDNVDLQVEAIWDAIAYDHTLAYINPPPAYAKESQRLRSPSSIMSSESGTCIDLALLMAAAIEYIGVRPVLFLIPGHAFCGYWRSEGEPEDRSVNTSQSQADLQALEAHFSKKLLNQESDIIQLATFTSDAWPHIRAQIRNGALVPLETTLLTMRESWSRATEEGEANLESSDRFEKGKNAMLDIGGARLAGITPLPLKEL